MVVRRRKKINRLLGERTRGHGDTKNRRGAGSRGGRGLAGSHKHKFSKYAGKFGKEKKKVISGKRVKALNIEQVVQAMPRLLEEKKAVKEGNYVVVDGQLVGFGKLLSRGSPGQKWVLRNVRASKRAVEKVEKAGGSVEQPDEGLEVAEEEAGEEVSEEIEEGKNEVAKGKEKEKKAEKH